MQDGIKENMEELAHNLGIALAQIDSEMASISKEIAYHTAGSAEYSRLFGQLEQLAKRRRQTKRLYETAVRNCSLDTSKVMWYNANMSKPCPPV